MEWPQFDIGGNGTRPGKAGNHDDSVSRDSESGSQERCGSGRRQLWRWLIARWVREDALVPPRSRGWRKQRVQPPPETAASRLPKLPRCRLQPFRSRLYLLPERGDLLTEHADFGMKYPFQPFCAAVAGTGWRPSLVAHSAKAWPIRHASLRGRLLSPSLRVNAQWSNRLLIYGLVGAGGPSNDCRAGRSERL